MPPRKGLIPLSRPAFGGEELAEIRGVLASGWVSNGPEVRLLEKRVAGYLGAGHAVAVTNCTAALHLSLLSLGVGPGDEVVVADYTYPATGHAVLYCGAKPVFADVDPRTFNATADSIRAKLTPRTKAIIPVHTFGQPAEMDAIVELGERRGIPVIEDAACALGAKYGGAYAGTFGSLGCLSFHARKGITTGEGGMAVTDDAALAERVRMLSTFGLRYPLGRQRRGFAIPSFTDLGFNYKMSDILAAVGVAQFRKMRRFIRERRRLAGYWTSSISGLGGVTPPYVADGAEHVYQSYVALVDAGVDRDRVIESLASCGVQAQIGTYALHIQPVYKSRDVCKNSLDVYRRAISLPLFNGLTKAGIDHAAECLGRALRKWK